jgi:hypothetical protein
MRIIAGLFFAFVLMMPSARALEVRSLEVVEYGIYTADKTSCARDAQGIERCSRSNVRHAATTRNIPAQIGVEFGLRYRVVGTPADTPISIKRIWRLPPPGFRTPSASKPITFLERVDEAVVGGEPVFVSYGFDDSWELITGPWILEFWHGNRKLSEQRFIMSRP